MRSRQDEQAVDERQALGEAMLSLGQYEAGGRHDGRTLGDSRLLRTAQNSLDYESSKEVNLSVFQKIESDDRHAEVCNTRFVNLIDHV